MENILSSEQMAAGMHTIETKDFLLLMHEGRLVATFSSRAKKAAIQKEATRYLLKLFRSAARS